jgi:flagellar biosynthesis protein FlhG
VTATRTASVLAIASGKGGVGKTNVAVNLSVALSRLGHRVGLVDADFGLGNVDVLLGLTPRRHIGHLLTGSATLEEIAIAGPAGVQIVPASSGLRSLTALTRAQRETLARAFDRLCSSLDFVLIDTASGIGSGVIDTILLADRVLVVTSVEPAAIIDAYATIKVLSAASPATDIGVVVNGVRNVEEAAATHRQLDMAARRFLMRSLTFYGFVSDDAAVRGAILARRAVVEHAPEAPASRCFRILAARLAGFGPGDDPGPKGILARRPSGRWSREVVPVPVHMVEVPQCA